MGCFEDNLIAYKLQYFLNFGGLGAASPFLHVFGRQLGLSQVSIGWVFALAPFLDMLLKPLVSSWADRRQVARPVFLGVLSVTTVALTALVLVPPLPRAPAATNGTSVLPPGADGTNATETVVLEAGPPDANVSDAGAPGGDLADLRQYQYWLYAVLVLLAWTGVSTNQSMADGMTAKVAEQRGADYGRQRLWGTVGLSTMTTVSGYLIEITSTGDVTNYSVGFYICGVFMSLDIILCIFCFKVPPEAQRPTKWSAMAAALQNWAVFGFAACCTAIGVSTGLLWSFHIWYLEDLARAAGYPHSRVQLLEGLTMLVKGLGCQIPLMFMSGAVLRRLGHRVALTLSMTALGLYFVLYSQLVDPWYCLLMEPLAGVAFGLLYPAIASYASSIAPAGTAVTTQAVMAACFDGLGVGLGTLLSAYVFDRYGGSATFLSFGVAALVVAALYHLIATIAVRHTVTGAELGIVFDDAVKETPSQAVLMQQEVVEEPADQDTARRLSGDERPSAEPV